MNTLARKCPTCQRPAGVQCIKIVRTPDQRVVWATSQPHEARVR